MSKTQYITYCLLFSLLAASLVSCQSEQRQKRVLVSVAASLTGVMRLIERKYEDEHRDVDLRLNTGSSASLARQILEGAPVDVFISANLEQMGRVAQKRTISPVPLLKGQLVLASANAMTEVSSLEHALEMVPGKIGICEASAPCGQYARTYLRKINAWSRVQSRLVPLKHAGQVLRGLQTGNLALAFLYETDLRVSEKTLTILYRPASSEVGPITYSAAVVAASGASSYKASNEFLQWLRGSEAGSHFRTAGFEIFGGSN